MSTTYPLDQVSEDVSHLSFREQVRSALQVRYAEASRTLNEVHPHLSPELNAAFADASSILDNHLACILHHYDTQIAAINDSFDAIKVKVLKELDASKDAVIRRIRDQDDASKKLLATSY